MKKFIVLLALTTVAFAASAQTVVYDYARLEYFGVLRQLVVVSTCDEQRAIDLKEKSGKDYMADHEQVMEEVARMETFGWVLYSYTERVTENHVWIMRKPK